MYAVLITTKFTNINTQNIIKITSLLLLTYDLYSIGEDIKPSAYIAVVIN